MVSVFIINFRDELVISLIILKYERDHIFIMEHAQYLFFYVHFKNALGLFGSFEYGKLIVSDYKARIRIHKINERHNRS